MDIQPEFRSGKPTLQPMPTSDGQFKLAWVHWFHARDGKDCDVYFTDMPAHASEAECRAELDAIQNGIPF